MEMINAHYRGAIVVFFRALPKEDYFKGDSPFAKFVKKIFRNDIVLSRLLTEENKAATDNVVFEDVARRKCKEGAQLVR